MAFLPFVLQGQVRVVSGGKMAVGHTTPVEQLDVLGGIKLGTTNSSNLGTIRFNGTNFQGYKSGSWLNLDSQGYWTKTGTNLSHPLGNVGIGTSSPSVILDVVSGSAAVFPRFKSAVSAAILDIDANAGSDAYVRLQQAGTTAMRFGYSGTGGYGFVQTENTNPLQLGVNGNTFATLTNAGHFGIGTAIPTERLHIAGSIRAESDFYSGNSTNKLYFNYNTGSGLGIISAASSGGNTDLSFRTSASGVENEALRITTERKVGIGTSSPTRRLSVVGTFQVSDDEGEFYGLTFEGGEGNNPTMQMGDWHNASGTVTWNSAGRYFRIDGQYGGGGAPILFTQNDGATEVMRVNSDNRVGIGTTAPSQKLDIDGNARIRSIGSSASSGALHYTSDGTLTTNTSDIHFKEKITRIKSPLKKIQRLRGVKYSWKEDKKAGRQIGLIAQEVEKILPELVFENPVDGYKGVHYDKLVAVLIEAMKEQQDQIENLKKQISQLRK